MWGGWRINKKRQGKGGQESEEEVSSDIRISHQQSSVKVSGTLWYERSVFWSTGEQSELFGF